MTTIDMRSYPISFELGSLDLGDAVSIERIQKQLKQLFPDGKIPVTCSQCGKEHLITLARLKNVLAKEYTVTCECGATVVFVKGRPSTREPHNPSTKPEIQVASHPTLFNGDKPNDKSKSETVLEASEPTCEECGRPLSQHRRRYIASKAEWITQC